MQWSGELYISLPSYDDWKAFNMDNYDLLPYCGDFAFQWEQHIQDRTRDLVVWGLEFSDLEMEELMRLLA